jgi:hypothetical protein
LHQAASSFFMGAFFGCSSRMNGKPSSPVLRGLGASNGARLLDLYPITKELLVIRAGNIFTCARPK